MVTIKKRPEDFIVTEIQEYELKQSGEYAIFLLHKTNYTTLAAINEIGKFLHIPAKKIGYAGLKDRCAITYQYISVPARFKEKLQTLTRDNITLTFQTFDDSPIYIGKLTANSFTIKVYDYTRIEPRDFLINYFGEQRFSTHNHIIGRALLQKNFELAINLIQQTAESFLQRKIQFILESQPNNYIGALQQLDGRHIKLYIHAYQSYIWNQTVEKYLESQSKSLDDLTHIFVPLVGFDFNRNDTDVVLFDIISHLLEKDTITPRDFIFKSIKHIVCEGGKRQLCVPISNLTINENTLSFTLPKGSYATEVIKQICL